MTNVNGAGAQRNVDARRDRFPNWRRWALPSIVGAAGWAFAWLSLSTADETDPEEFASGANQTTQAEPPSGAKRIIGATARIVVTDADVAFFARVDTGAHTTSLHVEEFEIENAEEDKRKNIGKKIRFRLKNHKGATAWVESVIDRTVIVKTSEQRDRRYKVPLTLRWNNLEKRVMVTLNDRSDMNYPVLLGRNFLRGDLLVDVEIDEVIDQQAGGED